MKTLLTTLLISTLTLGSLYATETSKTVTAIELEDIKALLDKQSKDLENVQSTEIGADLPKDAIFEGISKNKLGEVTGKGSINKGDNKGVKEETTGTPGQKK